MSWKSTCIYTTPQAWSEEESSGVLSIYLCPHTNLERVSLLVSLMPHCVHTTDIDRMRVFWCFKCLIVSTPHHRRGASRESPVCPAFHSSPQRPLGLHTKICLSRGSRSRLLKSSISLSLAAGFARRLTAAP